MADRYRSFSQLRASEKDGRDFRVRCVKRNADLVILAPHGGAIEPGTSEVAEAIAANDFSFYAFEGLKPRGNRELHITSTAFDEPDCLTLLKHSNQAVSIHGENSDQKVVFLGGRDVLTLNRLRAALQRRGFSVEIHRNPRLLGWDEANICNRAESGLGIQLELSKGLRRSLFSSLSKNGRKTKTNRFRELVDAVRECVR